MERPSICTRRRSESCRCAGRARRSGRESRWSAGRGGACCGGMPGERRTVTWSEVVAERPPDWDNVARIKAEMQVKLDAVAREEAAAARAEALREVDFGTHVDRRGRPFVVPDRLWRLEFDRAFAVVLPPLHVQWSGPRRPWDLSDRRDRARAYEVILREGNEGDLWRFVDGALLAGRPRLAARQSSHRLRGTVAPCGSGSGSHRRSP